MKGKKRLIALLLSFLMVLSQMSVATFALDTVADENSDQTVQEQAVEETQPEADVKTAAVETEPAATETATEETAAESEVAQPAAAEPAKAEPAKAEEKKAEPEKAEAKEEAFDQSQTVDGVTVNVSAAKGVFPAGSKLSVSKVAVPDAVDTSDAEAAYAFDISILANGEKIQPDGNATVSFTTEEVADYDTAVYHMDGGAQKMSVSESGETASVTTTGFSVYIVTFTYGEGQSSVSAVYSLNQGDKVKVKDMLNELGIEEIKSLSNASSTDSGVIDLVREGTSNTLYAEAKGTGEATISVTINYKDGSQEPCSVAVKAIDHVHNLVVTKTDEGNAQIACTDEECPYHDEPFIVEMTAEHDVYTGSGYEYDGLKLSIPEFPDDIDTSIYIGGDPSVSYNNVPAYRKQKEGGGWTGWKNFNDNPITAAGTYQMRLYVGAQNAGETKPTGVNITRTFTIHEHYWVVTKTDDGNAQIACTNEGCPYDEPFVVTMTAENDVYTGSGYVYNKYAVTGLDELPEDVASCIIPDGPMYRKRTYQNWTYFSETPITNAGTYEQIRLKVSAQNEGDTEPLGVNIVRSATIDPAEVTLDEPEEATGLKYNGRAQCLLNDGGILTPAQGVTLPDDAKIQYFAEPTDDPDDDDPVVPEEDDWSDNWEDAKGTDAGFYRVWYRVVGLDSTNYVLIDEGEKFDPTIPIRTIVKIDKANPKVTEPKAKNLTYNGQAQELVDPATTTGGTIEYALGEKDAAPESGWSTSIPKGTEVGDYYVWCRVVGDENYEGVDPICVVSKIVARQFTISYDLNGGKLNGQTGVVTTKVEEGTVITLPAPTRDGYKFDYWEGSKYNAGDKYTVTGDHTFKAVWKTSGTGKKGNGVNTGDTNDIAGLMALMIASIGALGAIGYRRRKEDQ